MRRGVNMVYIVENNGVYGLTKGQFSATSDKGAKSKRGVVNSDEAIDMVGMALQLGATFVARSFSGDKAPARAADRGRAAATRAPPSSTASRPASRSTTTKARTKSFDFVREHNEAVNYLDVIDGRDRRSPSITHPARWRWCSSTTAPGCGCASSPTTTTCTTGSRRWTYLQQRHAAGEIVTGLLYVDPEPRDLHHHMNTVATPLNALDDAALIPGAAALEKLNAGLR